MSVTERAATIREVWPLLVVMDIETSVRFYRDTLGFAVEHSAEDQGKLFWCRLSRGGSSLMLQSWDPEDGPAEGRGRGVSLYFLCDDVEPLYEELTSLGLELDAPQVAPYGMKQLVVPEPDGYFLCFESDTSKGRS